MNCERRVEGMDTTVSDFLVEQHSWTLASGVGQFRELRGIAAKSQRLQLPDIRRQNLSIHSCYCLACCPVSQDDLRDIYIYIDGRKHEKAVY